MEFKFKPSFSPIEELYRTLPIGESVTVKGWVRTKRSQPKMAFVGMYDGSHPTPLQLIFSDPSLVSELSVGDTISATGKVVKSPAKGQQIELDVTKLIILGRVSDPSTYLPCVKAISLDTLREHQALRAKFRVPQSVFRIRSTLSKLVHQYFALRKVHHLDPNIITTSDCEGAGETFTISTLLGKKRNEIPVTASSGEIIDYSADFFGLQASLTVSSQLQLEALAAGMGAVYTTNPSFRAEQSKTRRHVACFTHVEWELPFITLDQLMDFSEDIVTYCIKGVLAESGEDLAVLEQFEEKGLTERLKSLVAEDFARMTYDHAIEIIERDADLIRKKFPEAAPLPIPTWGDDLGSYCERYLAEDICKSPVFVHSYPLDLKSFYMKQCPSRPDGRRVVESCDLLIPGTGELIGSSIREDNHDLLHAEMMRRKMDVHSLEWYLDLRKDATFPHGGAGMGFDRLVAICTTGHIQDAIPFPASYRRPPGA